jgi:hypothetical protein
VTVGVVPVVVLPVAGSPSSAVEGPATAVRHPARVRVRAVSTPVDERPRLVMRVIVSTPLLSSAPYIGWP